MSRTFDWYGKVSQSEHLEQGDFIHDCPILKPTTDVLKEGDQIETDISLYNVVIMTQSCDLIEEKVNLVLVCPYFTLTQLANADSKFSSKGAKEEVRQGKNIRLHMLNSCEIKGFEREPVVVDFSSVYSVPFETLKKIVSNKGVRIRLLPPYREHLSQAFARFFMRVGLPSDIPSFK